MRDQTYCRQTTSGERPAFTLLEVLVAVAIIATLYGIVYGTLGGIFSQAYEARSNAELNQLGSAFQRYLIRYGSYPPEAAHGYLPDGMDEFMATGEWPTPPWPGSSYDWDVFNGSDGSPAYQISLRFCEKDQALATCTPTIPEEEWAEGFDAYSSYYFCISGRCKAHTSQIDDHPAHCFNCNQ